MLPEEATLTLRERGCVLESAPMVAWRARRRFMGRSRVSADRFWIVLASTRLLVSTSPGNLPCSILQSDGVATSNWLFHRRCRPGRSSYRPRVRPPSSLPLAASSASSPVWEAEEQAATPPTAPLLPPRMPWKPPPSPGASHRWSRKPAPPTIAETEPAADVAVCRARGSAVRVAGKLDPQGRPRRPLAHLPLCRGIVGTLRRVKSLNVRGLPLSCSGMSTCAYSSLTNLSSPLPETPVASRTPTSLNRAANGVSPAYYTQ